LPDQALAANVNNLELALTGKIDLLRMIHGDGGGGGASGKRPQARPMTADRFRAMTTSHNARLRGQRRGAGE